MKENDNPTSAQRDYMTFLMTIPPDHPEYNEELVARVLKMFPDFYETTGITPPSRKPIAVS